jgi:hypothetical protein
MIPVRIKSDITSEYLGERARSSQPGEMSHNGQDRVADTVEILPASSNHVHLSLRQQSEAAAGHLCFTHLYSREAGKKVDVSADSLKCPKVQFSLVNILQPIQRIREENKNIREEIGKGREENKKEYQRLACEIRKSTE